MKADEHFQGLHESVHVDAAVAAADNEMAEHDLNVTEDDLLEAKELAATFSLEDTRTVSTLFFKKPTITTFPL